MPVFVENVRQSGVRHDALIAMSEMEQRRNSPRVVSQIVVRYRLPSASVWHVTTLKDFSRDGARLMCEEPFSPGQQLELSLGLPLFPHAVQFQAQVVWSKPRFLGSMAIAEHGVTFSSIDDVVRGTIDRAVRRFLSKRKKP